jgi:hypothetical protein
VPYGGYHGDGVIQKIGEVWVMFYFGAFWKEEAFSRFFIRMIW